MTTRTKMRRPWLVLLLASIAMLTATERSVRPKPRRRGFGGGRRLWTLRQEMDTSVAMDTTVAMDTAMDTSPPRRTSTSTPALLTTKSISTAATTVRDRPIGGYARSITAAIIIGIPAVSGIDTVGSGGWSWGAPIGAFVSVLPPYYSTVWFGGVPYYYADDTYYDWSPLSSSTKWWSRPPASTRQARLKRPPATRYYLSQRTDSHSEQQASDQYDCHRSAVDQTGYDPTLAGGGVSAEAAAAKRVNYFRADAACLDARGYSVQ